MKNGVIVYAGSSLFTGEPIFCALVGLTRPSANIKTGPMAQFWVVPAELPTQAIKNKRDTSVCGSCPLRHKICYVRPDVINRVYKSIVTGKYTFDVNWALDLIKLNKLKLRITAFGEAPAVPYEVFEPFFEFAHTGYTHAWANPKCDQRWKGKLMASVHTRKEAELAQSFGWKTFRIILKEEKPADNELLCDNAATGIQCQNCMKCNGNSFNIVDPIHGLSYKQANFYKTFRPRQLQLSK